MARAKTGLRTWQRTVNLDEEELAKTWKRYDRTRSVALRNRLAEHYLPLVKYNSERIYAKLPDEVQLDDLISAGWDGLRDAIENFDLTRGVKFETYCALRISGSILDSLRNNDWVPRLVRSRAAKLAAARHELETELGRAAQDHELADHMGLSAAEYDKFVRDAHAIGMISLSRNFADADSNREIREQDLLANEKSENPAQAIHEDDIRTLITKGMSKNERLILLLYYYESMTMKEIGATLDLSESRVSQMHTAIIDRLKTNLAGREDEFASPEF